MTDEEKERVRLECAAEVEAIVAEFPNEDREFTDFEALRFGPRLMKIAARLRAIAGPRPSAEVVELDSRRHTTSRKEGDQ
jgi:hypothetical protein